jgi:IS5 family transposase
MSFSHQGLSAKVKSTIVQTFVPDSDPYLKLANLINWDHLASLALPDLKSTTAKGFWYLGRTLYLRIHLGVLILQVLLKATDRTIEFQVKSTPVFQVFCGQGLIRPWKCPDHTKIEEFRNRLSVSTNQSIGNYILKLAVESGFANPAKLDVDSTVQEANIAYPSDASLMKKLSLKCTKVLDYLLEKGKKYVPDGLTIDIKKIIKKSRQYFFLAKNTAKERKQELFAEYHSLVKEELKDFIKFIETISPSISRHLPWNIQLHLNQIKEKGWRYLLDVAHFVRTNTIKPGKLLSFTMEDVICVKKGKAGKENEFGRVFQVGRIEGNFLVAYTSNSLRMEDKIYFQDIIQEHETIFQGVSIETITTDKGYYSKENVALTREVSGNADGIQRPANVKDQVEEGHQKESLYCRRSGVEPVIGHAKNFGLGKSKMKSDGATLASGYRSVLGFNLHQLKRKIEFST